MQLTLMRHYLGIKSNRKKMTPLTSTVVTVSVRIGTVGEPITPGLWHFTISSKAPSHFGSLLSRVETALAFFPEAGFHEPT